MSLAPGRRLGPYEILSPIGAGGMGEVYKARDARLDRDLAIKVLPAEVGSDPERLKRFETEARAASALNHPNILTVYDIGSADSISYIAMEFVDGKPLRDLLAAGPLPIRKLLEVGVQIADGLASAHDAGIIHRDLKPGNVMVSREGFVKILDFGLAKLTAPPLAAGSASRQPTMTAAQTSPGQILGTVDYMSPEQAVGEPLDFRSDQFSLGSVLYEMATGKRPFAGKTPIDTLSAILHEEPEPIAPIRPESPVPLRWIIERCLSKSPADRYASTRDLARDLREVGRHLSDLSAEPVSPARRRRALPVLAAALASVAVVAAVWLLSSGPWRRPDDERFRRLTFRRGHVSRALFVPNSNSILYTGAWEGQPARTYLTLPESFGSDQTLESRPQLPMVFSETGSELLVLLGASRDSISPSGTLAWKPTLGGEARQILEKSGWADWASRSRRFALVRDTGSERRLEVCNPEGRPQQTLFRTSGAISFVRFSPDERGVAFIHHPTAFDRGGEVKFVRTDGSGVRTLSDRYDDCFGLAWNRGTGEIWFTASSGGASASSVLRSVTPSGKKRTVQSLAGRFVLQDVAPDGKKSLLTSDSERLTMILRRGGEPPRNLSWFDWTLVTDLSPDGKFVLFSEEGGSAEKMSGSWVRPVDGGDAVYRGKGQFGRFSSNGEWIIALTPGPEGPLQLILHPNGPGESRQLTFTKANHWAPAFAGRRTVLFVRSESGKSEVWRTEIDGSGPRPLGATGCDLPMADAAGETFLCIGGPGHRTILVYSLQGGPGRTLFELTRTAPIRYARWNGRGDRVFAATGDGRLLVIEAQTGKLIEEQELPVPGSEPYDDLLAAAVGADGSTQAYSVTRRSSDLYIASGLR